MRLEERPEAAEEAGLTALFEVVEQTASDVSQPSKHFLSFARKAKTLGYLNTLTADDFIEGIRERIRED